ncbi:MAG TPA: hypothetical protein VKP88_05050 [Candidatus Paceibacterota bacterium]|nr:hypothetical protein [Candidatus Paceibacterota bacterium]
MLKVTTVFFVLSLFVLAVLHQLALRFFLYWRWEWIDIGMHFFGGAVVALGVFTARDFIRRIPERFEFVVPVMSAVVVVVLAWEILELQLGIAQIADNFVLDTVLDVTVGIIGGFVGFLLGHSLRKI